MTRKQARSVSLSQQIFRGTLEAALLIDDDWHLLLLAAGSNNLRALPRAVAQRVLSEFSAQGGYSSKAQRPAGPMPERVLQRVG